MARNNDKSKDIEYKVKNCILENSLINDQDKIVVAVSGGPDSMCLLNLLLDFKDKFEKEHNIVYNICVAHVNHMIRKEAYDEKIYVENFCKENNIEFYYLEKDVLKLAQKLKISDETCARKVRYDFFDEICVKANSNKIAVAHNLDDNIETILLNFIRGTGLKGLTGMGYIFKNIIRPLLDIQKSDILEYNNMKKLNPCFDKTNEEAVYTRNKIRLNLIPMIKNEYNPNIVANISRLKHILEADEKFLDNYTKKVVNLSIIDNTNNKLKFDFQVMLKEEESIKLRSIRKLLEIKMGNVDGIENIHVMDILKLLANNTKGKKYIIGNKFTIEILDKYIAYIY